jgi:hypothetical protein
VTAEDAAVLEAIARVAADTDPMVAWVAGGWADLLVDEATAGMRYLGLVAEGLGSAGVALPLAGTAVVWPTLFGESAGGRRVAVADRVLDDGLAEDGAGSDRLVVLDGEATAHDDFAVEPVGGLDGDGLARVLRTGPVVARCANPCQLDEARRRAAAVTSAEMAGVIRRVSDLTNAYVVDREQFGRQIAAFQAVAHGTARLATLAEAATWAARAACRSADVTLTLAAKGWVSQASAEATAISHQLHGAVGFTEEYGLQRLTKRLRTLRFAWGDDRANHLALGRLLAGVTGSGDGQIRLRNPASIGSVTPVT